MTTDDPQDVIDPASMIHAGSSSEQDPAEVPADTVMQIGGIWGSLVSQGGRFLKKMSLRPGSERDDIGKDDEGSTAMAGGTAHNMSADGVFDSDEESEMGTHARSVDPISDAERERQAIIIFQISKAGDAFLRVDLSRLDLLAECRRDVERGLRHKHKGHSAAEVLREVGEGLQPRDMRRLVEGQDHVILARAGATVLALGYLSAVVTHVHAYVVTPEGADELLQPLLLRLHRHAGAAEPEMPFEFRVFEAVLLTLVTRHAEAVAHCVREKVRIAAGMREDVSSKMLRSTWRLKSRIVEVLGELRGVETALEEAQEDEETMSLMYLSAMQEDPAEYARLVKEQRGATHHLRLLLDSYQLEFHNLYAQLELLLQEIVATEDLLKLQLDVARNNLWKVDILIGMASMYVGLASLVAGFFGMNMHTGWVDELAGPYDYLPWTDCGNCTLVRGPSWAFFNVTVWSGGGCLMLIIATALWLWLHGYLRS